MTEPTSHPPQHAPDDDAAIAWEPWTAAAFDRAARERKPVLLSITATWCHGCDVMDSTTYRDPAIVRSVTAGVVPVRVDADRRPDVNTRYNLEGWPTTALLTPGGEILAGSTYLPPAAMASMLEEGTVALRDRYEDLMRRADAAAAARRAATPRARYEPDGDAPAWLAARMREAHDPSFGGFGAGGQFPNAALLQFGLAYCARTRDAGMAAVVTRSLDAISWGGLFDEVDGGVFRYAAGRDFTRPHTEKLLEDQVALAGVLLEASAAFGRRDYHDRAIDVIRYVRRTLSAEHGGFYASQKPDPDYYALSGSIRETMDAPSVDRTLFTDRNAQAIVAWLDAAALLGDSDLARFAAATAERVLGPTRDRPLGYRHWTDPDAIPDLLGDQVHAAAAWLRLFEATGTAAHLECAVDAMRIGLERFRDPDGGGLLDRAPGGADEVGRLCDRVMPLSLNGLAARVMSRLAGATGDGEWILHARQALGAVTGMYRAQELGAAPYALAVLELPS